MGSESTTTTTFDVVIIGGGMVGATTAFCLASAEPTLRIAIVEPVAPTTNLQPSFDQRAIAIAEGTASYFQRCGLWQHLAPHAAPIHDIHVSDRGHFGKVRLSRGDYAVEALGYVIEVAHYGQRIQQQLSTLSNVTWFRPASVQQWQTEPESVHLSLSSGEQVSGKLVLACDGANSPTREHMHISTQQSSYHQTAIIATLTLKASAPTCAYERFTQYGPMALLPLPADVATPRDQQRYSLVWCVSEDDVDQKISLSDSQFIQACQQAFGYRAGRIVHTSERNAYPLSLVYTDRLVNHRSALIGNASHTIHPIAGQGFNLGARDIALITEKVSATHRVGEDIGGMSLLMDYEAQRQSDLHTVIQATHSIVHLFSNDNRLMAAARNIGLSITDKFSSLKQLVAYQAMGWRS